MPYAQVPLGFGTSQAAGPQVFDTHRRRMRPRTIGSATGREGMFPSPVGGYAPTVGDPLRRHRIGMFDQQQQYWAKQGIDPSQPHVGTGRPAIDPNAGVYGTAMLGGGWQSVAPRQFGYSQGEQESLAQQRSIGQSSMPAGISPSYRRFASGGEFGAPAPAQPAAGMGRLTVGTTTESGSKVMQMPDGRIVVGGRAYTSPGEYERTPAAAVGRYNAMGGNGVFVDTGGRGSMTYSPETMQARREAHLGMIGEKAAARATARRDRAIRRYGLTHLQTSQAAQAEADSKDQALLGRFAIRGEDGAVADYDYAGYAGALRGQYQGDPQKAWAAFSRNDGTIEDIDAAIESVGPGWMGVEPKDPAMYDWLWQMKAAATGQKKPQRWQPAFPEARGSGVPAFGANDRLPLSPPPPTQRRRLGSSYSPNF